MFPTSALLSFIVWTLLPSSSANTTLHSDTKQVLTAQTVATLASGSSTNQTSTSPTPTSPAWNTSLLCKHLANITASQKSPPPPTEESIEAKCFPGFVCVNGICTGGMSCKCNEGWAGLFCQEKCPEKCAPDGECATSTGNQAICICNETSVYSPGEGCVPRVEEPSTTTVPTTTEGNLRPRSERLCFGASLCVHGYCDLSSLQCLCDRGWKGQLCNEKCDLNCGKNGRCRESSDYIFYCVCDPGYNGSRCENLILKPFSTTTVASTAGSEVKDAQANSLWYLGDHSGDAPTSTVLPETTGEPDNGTYSSTTASVENVTGLVNVTGSDVAVNSTTTASMVEVNTTMRPLEERQCVPGIVCEHGYCQKTAQLVACVCDSGYAGALCETPCPRACGANQTCDIAGDGSQICRCRDGYSGARCNVYDPPTTTASLTTVTDLDRISTTPDNESTTLVRVSTTLGVQAMDDPWEPLAGFGPLVPLALRMCTQGFVCRYGNCSRALDGMQCVCEPSFRDVFCNEPCTLDCGPKGICQFSDNKTEVCECTDKHYTGPTCSELRPLEEEAGLSPWLGVGIAAVILLVSSATIVLAIYLMWKQQNITIMNLVYWLQPYEDDDGRDYDAFVSYASADQDRQFVIQTLVPRLEGRMCYTLCIHQRNFIPGLYITDNITGSVKRSRRTILILSPAFVASGWCKFEYQMALQEMLCEKHRILPIILGDISHLKQDMDDTLKTILKTVTWLEYPGKDSSDEEMEKFWKRLALSLPKRRPGQMESMASQSCLTSPSTQTKHEDIVSDALKAPLEIRSFHHSHPKGPPLKQIVRVPAVDLDTESSSSQAPIFCLQLNRLLNGSSESDSKPSSLSPLDPYYVSPRDQHPPDYPQDDAGSLTKLAQSQQTSPSTTVDLSDKLASWPEPKAGQNGESILDKYLGDGDLARQLAV
ncbi:multiple epidermal growth factor-like domains protein 11 [Physella acuta]|uniref:multiple epidermal growth factor-like domains protein 11 n=1 Tax=Physella acuta TaxID=109671 RepID=UPI0027DBE8EB|nr:multiple epidermal growth factor-like domains protein 11 [Physella acuta]